MPVDVLSAGSLSSVTVATMSDVSGGGEGIPDVTGNKPSLRVKGAWVEGNAWAATTTALGGVKQAAKQTDLDAGADAAAIVTSVNALMAALRDAGIMAK